MVHPFYIVVTVVAELVTCTSFASAAYQVCLDYKNLPEVFLLRTFKTHRVFRICAFTGSLAWMVAFIDFYGVFGIHSANTRMALHVVAMMHFAFAISIACFNELVVALSFLKLSKSKHRAWTVAVRVLVFVHVFAEIFIYCVSMFVENHNLFISIRAMDAVTAVFIISEVIGVYLALRHHFNGLSKSGIASSGLESWEKLLKQWRINSAATVVAFGLLLASVLVDLFTKRDPIRYTRNNINFDIDPNNFPSFHAALAPITCALLLGTMSWRALIQLRATRAKSKVLEDQRLTGSGESRPASPMKLTIETVTNVPSCGKSTASFPMSRSANTSIDVSTENFSSVEDV